MLTTERIDTFVSDVRCQMEILKTSTEGTPFEKQRDNLDFIHTSVDELDTMLRSALELPPGEDLDDLVHSVRTPLAVIIGFSEIWLNLTNLTEPQQKALKTIHQSGAELSRLVEYTFR
jgi:signal transduction histidine kinase